uniref:No apical meristem-associated C-terminal domain-containing protein n=1 Tax=Oryza brachyantha TaxID=4533 RepID=J3LVZ9_ORYBR
MTGLTGLLETNLMLFGMVDTESTEPQSLRTSWARSKLLNTIDLIGQANEGHGKKVLHDTVIAPYHLNDRGINLEELSGVDTVTVLDWARTLRASGCSVGSQRKPGTGPWRRAMVGDAWPPAGGVRPQPASCLLRLAQRTATRGALPASGCASLPKKGSPSAPRFSVRVASPFEAEKNVIKFASCMDDVELRRLSGMIERDKNTLKAPSMREASLVPASVDSCCPNDDDDVEGNPLDGTLKKPCGRKVAKRAKSNVGQENNAELSDVVEKNMVKKNEIDSMEEKRKEERVKAASMKTKAKAKSKDIELNRMVEEERIMSIDTSTLNGPRKMYYEFLQNEFLVRRLKELE